MIYKLLFLISFSFFFGLSAQESPNTSYLYNPDDNPLNDTISHLHQSISGKVFEIEQLHAKIVPYNHSMDREIIINGHLKEFTYKHGRLTRYEKETILCFSQNRLTKIEFLSKKRYLENNTGYQFKHFIFSYPDFDKSKLITRTIDGRSLQYLKYFSDENKIQALEKVDKNLQQSIYKLEVLLYKYQQNRSAREQQNLDL